MDSCAIQSAVPVGVPAKEGRRGCPGAAAALLVGVGAAARVSAAFADTELIQSRPPPIDGGGAAEPELGLKALLGCPALAGSGDVAGLTEMT